MYNPSLQELFLDKIEDYFNAVVIVQCIGNFGNFLHVFSGTLFFSFWREIRLVPC